MRATVSNTRLAIVVPSFNDEPSVYQLHAELSRILGRFVNDALLLVVDDGSFPPFVYRSPESTSDIPMMVLRLRRNLGHQSAVAIGLAYASAEMPSAQIVVMDGDGEDDPVDVPRLLEALALSPSSVVVAERTERSESLSFRILYRLYRLAFYLLSGSDLRFGNFSALAPATARRLTSMTELYLSYPGTLIRSRLPILRVKTKRSRRYNGVSKMNLAMLVAHGIAGLAVLLDQVMARLLVAATTVAAAAATAFLVALVLKIFGHATPGWLTIVAGSAINLIVTTILLLLLGLILGIYQRLAIISNPAGTFVQFIEAVLPATRETMANPSVPGQLKGDDRIARSF